MQPRRLATSDCRRKLLAVERQTDMERDRQKERAIKRKGAGERKSVVRMERRWQGRMRMRKRRRVGGGGHKVGKRKKFPVRYISNQTKYSQHKGDPTSISLVTTVSGLTRVNIGWVGVTSS